MIMRIIEKTNVFKESCDKLIINWYYQKDDIDMRDFGYELLDVSDCPINISAKENE
ncbi:hypothetical protein ES705_42350 [subsurface metagenome]